LTYSDAEKVRRLATERARVESRLEQATEEWARQSEELEQIQARLAAQAALQKEVEQDAKQ
jgi:K+/H+ antiporter YhaU regulatory subunit KhtT